MRCCVHGERMVNDLWMIISSYNQLHYSQIFLVLRPHHAASTERDPPLQYSYFHDTDSVPVAMRVLHFTCLQGD